MYSDGVPGPPGALRIGEFARRVGVNPELLRAWERRYGLLQPIRTEGGFRLYTAADAERVGQMKRALADGLSAAEAARRAREPERTEEAGLEHPRERLLAAAHAYDESAIHSILDEALRGFTLETVLRELVLPVLHEIGDEWERGELEVGEEHFATTVIRERLLALSRFWSRGGDPLAILACAPGELHDIGLIAFGLVLRSHGWRIYFLGASTPVESRREGNGRVPTAAGRGLEHGRCTARRRGRRAASAGPLGAARSLGPRSVRGALREAAHRPSRRRSGGRGRDGRPGMSSGPTILVTGATGYVGGRLLPALLERGESVRCLARRPEAVMPREGLEVVAGDALDAASVRRALEGIEVAYYLIHAMGTTDAFEERDRAAATIFAEAASAAGVQRIVYLGGLGSGPELSSHLASRQEVGRVLASTGVRDGRVPCLDRDRLRQPLVRARPLAHRAAARDDHSALGAHPDAADRRSRTSSPTSSRRSTSSRARAECSRSGAPTSPPTAS